MIEIGTAEFAAVMFGAASVGALLGMVGTWDYWRRKLVALQQQVARERATAQAMVDDVKIREQVYRNVTMGDLEKSETHL